MKRPSPGRPTRSAVRTGDQMRVEVVADRAGYLTVFNVGPAGQLNVLYPEEGSPPPSPLWSALGR